MHFSSSAHTLSTRRLRGQQVSERVLRVEPVSAWRFLRLGSLVSDWLPLRMRCRLHGQVLRIEHPITLPRHLVGDAHLRAVQLLHGAWVQLQLQQDDWTVSLQGEPAKTKVKVALVGSH